MYKTVYCQLPPFTPTLPVQQTHKVVLDAENAFWQTCPSSVKQFPSLRDQTIVWLTKDIVWPTQGMFARKRFQHLEQLCESAALEELE